MKKICTVSGKEFEITPDDLKFYEKMGVPAPMLCPEERQRRRLAWRNERCLYKRKCDLCEKSMISIYHEAVSFPVYCLDCWWSDKWDVSLFNQKFDFTFLFFEQVKSLFTKVPRRALFITGNNENSRYTNCAGSNKNCYLLMGNSGWNEDCSFGNGVTDSCDCLDVYFGQKNELCYEIINCLQCFNVRFSQDCSGCSDSFFLKSCIGCKSCFGCVNLRNKEYYFLNQKYSKEEYLLKMETLFLETYTHLKNMRSQFQSFLLQHPRKYSEIVRSEACEGDWIFNSKNCRESYEIVDSEDCKWCFATKSLKDSFDLYGFGYFSEMLYETVGVGGAYNVIGSFSCDSSSNINYCYECDNSHDLFGCIGLKHKQYCILNKQYTKEEYFKLRDKIIEHMKKTGEWGEFFPIEMSPFGYNETVAQEYFPMTKKEALELGYGWRDEVKNEKLKVKSVEIPDSITEVPDDIVKEVLSCQECEKQYKIQKAELKFYRKMNLPIPRKCPDCRHLDRMKLRNPRKLWTRKCDKCSIEIQTTFRPERPEKVFCEKCYLEAVN